MTKSWKVFFLALVAAGVILVAYHLRAVLMPLVVALILAYILNPILQALERRKVPRLASILGIYVVLAGLLFGLFVSAIPACIVEAREFVRDTITGERPTLERVIVWGGKQLKDWLGADTWDQVVRNLRERVKGHETDLVSAGGSLVGSILAFMTQSIAGFVSVFSFIALVPVYLFFLLKNMNPWWERFTHVIPRNYREQVLATLDRIHRANASFFRGQITISFLEGLGLFLALWLLRVKFALLFGALYMVLSLVPFLGLVIGFTTTELFVFADAGRFSPAILVIAGVYVLILILDATVLQPLIMGGETGLHPMAIILALLTCGQLFGIFGMLIAVPIASTAKILFEDYVWPIFTEVADLTRTRLKPPPSP
jgi:predicted PurR-regulated permease PerM